MTEPCELYHLLAFMQGYYMFWYERYERCILNIEYVQFVFNISHARYFPDVPYFWISLSLSFTTHHFAIPHFARKPPVVRSVHQPGVDCNRFATVEVLPVKYASWSRGFPAEGYNPNPAPKALTFFYSPVHRITSIPPTTVIRWLCW